MNNIKWPLNFVLEAKKIWPELEDGKVKEIDQDRLADLSIESFDCWINQTYYWMALAGLDVSISSHPRPDVINIFPPFQLNRLTWKPSAFSVSVRADSYHSRFADFVITQNQTRTTDGKYSGYVPHWPQPGLRPRDPSRGAFVQNIVFKGFPNNQADFIQANSFIDRIQEMGMEVVLNEQQSVSADSRKAYGLQWRDYTQADIVLAVRRASAYDLSNKPASKLVNSWMAGVPAILGREVGFLELRRTPLDYIEATSERQVLESLSFLKNNSQAFDAIVENGLMRSSEFSVMKVLERWIELFNGSILTCFKDWRQKSYYFYYYSSAVRIVRDNIERKYHSRMVHRSPKVIRFD